jgi:hypothetical protein
LANDTGPTDCVDFNYYNPLAAAIAVLSGVILLVRRIKIAVTF